MAVFIFVTYIYIKKLKFTSFYLIKCSEKRRKKSHIINIEINVNDILLNISAFILNISSFIFKMSDFILNISDVKLNIGAIIINQICLRI